MAETKAEREARLAAALRQNLKRRKSQARERDTQKPAPETSVPDRVQPETGEPAGITQIVPDPSLDDEC